MKNGIAYPLAPELIKEIEKKRKEYSRNIGCKVSQARFTSIIASKLKLPITKIKFNLRPTIKRKRWN